MEEASFRPDPQELHTSAEEVSGIGNATAEDTIEAVAEDNLITMSRPTSKRSNSPRQTEASRMNGSKSKGPKSATGKNAVRLNALRNGAFSNEIVIEAAGERLEDFHAFGKQIEDFFKPTDILEKVLVKDIIENAWRRQRVRRCEAMELNNKLKAQQARDYLELAARVEHLKTEFVVRFQDLVGATFEEFCWNPRVQEELASSSLGMEFLISQMRGVECQVGLDGYISRRSLGMLEACGIDVNTRACCELWGGDGKNEIEGDVRVVASQIDTAANQVTCKGRNPYKKILLKNICEAIAALEKRRKKLQSVENMEAKTRTAMTLVPPDSADRFSRAETAYERRMYRALLALCALRGDTLQRLRIPGISLINTANN